MLARLGLGTYLHRHPSDLSGGQQQRVGLARALAVRPRLFLFDEPTANLDAALKTNFAQEIRQQQQEARVAGLYVTHDVREAFAVADRVMVLEHGRIEQIGSPMDIYECPRNEAIAGLCGLYTLLPGQIEALLDGEGALVTIAGHMIPARLLEEYIRNFHHSTKAGQDQKNEVLFDRQHQARSWMGIPHPTPALITWSIAVLDRGQTTVARNIWKVRDMPSGGLWEILIPYHCYRHCPQASQAPVFQKKA